MKSWKAIIATCASVAAVSVAGIAHADTRPSAGSSDSAAAMHRHAHRWQADQTNCVGPNSYCQPYFGN